MSLPPGPDALTDLQLATADLSGRLGEAYDQVDFLYQLGRSMCALEKAGEFYTSTVAQLHCVLDFQWIVMKMTSDAAQVAGLGKAVILSGRLPCEFHQLDPLFTSMSSGAVTDQPTKVIEPESNQYAQLTGSQILVELATTGTTPVGALFCGNKRGHDPEISSHDLQLVDAAAGFIASYHQNLEQYQNLQRLFVGSVKALSSAIDAKDPYTRGHSARVGVLGRSIGLALGQSDDQAQRLYIAGLVHDIGKIGVPEHILRKPAKLTDEEFAHIKRHPQVGFDILHDIPEMADVLPAVLHHHERWDGNGYPHGLAAEDIPPMGRLLAVADGFDAMSSDRAYRDRMTREKVLGILRDGAGSQWDPAMVEAFLSIDLAEFDELLEQHQKQTAQAA